MLVLLAILASGCCTDRAEATRENEARRLAALDAALDALGLTRVELELACAPDGTSFPATHLPAASSPLGYCTSGIPDLAGGSPPAFAKDSKGTFVALKENVSSTQIDDQTACECWGGKGIAAEPLNLAGKLPDGALVGSPVTVSYSYGFVRIREPSDCQGVP